MKFMKKLFENIDRKMEEKSKESCGCCSDECAPVKKTVKVDKKTVKKK